MQVRNYAQYFSIDESYYPEINPESVKDKGLKWSNTYPHKGFIDFLKALVNMLRRGSNVAKHDLLVHGAFGTGKSRFLWAAQNLLDCSDKEFESYFDHYDALKKESDLKEKLSALRHGKILTVFRYSSGEIGTTKDFVMAVYESISKELIRKGYNTVAERTMRGSIAKRIASKELKPMFENCFSMAEYRGLGSIYGKSVDEIVQQLNNPSRSAENLLSDLFKIADDVGVVIYEAKVDFLKEWISEVIDKNGLSHIVFIWDEFSSFFRKMKDVLDSLQNLQEIHDRKPFNFIVAVHESYAEGTEGSAVFDRFNQVAVEMPDVVAFDLIHDAIKPIEIPGIKEEYTYLMKDIVHYTDTARSTVCRKTKIDENIMKNILPIHPMAALMLKYISVEFASNQRSMFNFIKNDSGDEMHAFQWFIKNRSPENGDILTIDYLWDFFYISGTDENSNVTGRNNLSRIIANILDTYKINEDRLDTEAEKRVLKTVLMMQAISRKQQHSLELLRPTEANIRLAFEGDSSLESDRAINIINNNLIAQKHILYCNTSGKQTLFEANMESGDQSKINEIEEKLRKDTKTEKLVQDAELISAFRFSDSLKSRFDFSYFATVDSIKPTVLGKILAENKKYKFKVVICFARNENEQTKFRDKIDECINDEKYKDIIFIDATACQLGNDAFEEWVKLSALEENFRNPDPSLADNKSMEAKNVLKTWKEKISSGNFRILKGSGYKRNCGSLEILKSALSEYVLSVYPLTFDNFSVTNTIFTNINYTAIAKYGIDTSKGGVFQEKDVNLLLGEVRNVAEYWKHFPENSLSKLKIRLEDVIHQKLDNERRIAISDIVDLLLENGFIPGALYAYLTGFLLKEYSGEPYRYSEGVQGDHGGLMSKTQLSTMIGEYFKHLMNNKSYKEQYIEVISDEQIAFINFVKNTFDISEILVVENAATKLRTYYKNRIRYSVWCFKTIMDSELEYPMQLISDIMYTESTETVPSLAEKFGKILIESPEISQKLSSLLTSDNAQKAMLKFLESFEDGSLLEYSKMIGVGNVLEDIRYVMQDAKSYLFDQAEGEEQLRKLLIDYKIIYESNDILDVKSSSLSGLMTNYKNYIKTLKMPVHVLKEHCKDIAFFLKCMEEIEKNSLISDEKKEAFLAELSGKKDSIRDLSRKIEEIYRVRYSIYTDGLDENELKDVIAKMQYVFLSTTSEFQSKLKSLTDEKKKDQAKTKLNELWNKLTDSKSPADWSVKNKMPIKIMLEKSESSLAESIFSAFSFGSRDVNVINDALSYLESEPEFIKRLKNQDELDDAFRSKMLERYSVILYDLDFVKNYIIDHCDVEPINWYGSAAVQHIIKELAESKYYNDANIGVMERIDDMSPEEAKKYLKELAQNDVEVGISIITKGGN